MTGSWVIITSIVVSASVVAEVVYGVWQWFNNKRLKIEDKKAHRVALESELITIFKRTGIPDKRLRVGNENYFQTVFFFPDKGITCKEHKSKEKCQVKKCQYLHGDQTSLDTLCQVIALARKRMDLCLYIITNDNLAKVITEAHKRGVIVRIILDKDQSDTSGTKRGNFLACGIQVRRNLENLMHHKFVVIDNELLVNGSFNWTSAAVMRNNENLVVSTDQNLVEAFSQEFEKLWKEFNPELPTKNTKY